MRLLKPQPGACLNPAHPLSQGLVACWLMNEGAGEIAHDYAGTQTATGDPAPAWGPGRCDFNGVDQVFFGNIALDLEKDFTVVATMRADPVSGEEDEYAAVGMGNPTYGSRFVLGYYSSGKYRCHLREDDNTNVVNIWNLGDELDDGSPHQLAFSFAPSAGAYDCLVDGAMLGTAAPSPYTTIHGGKASIGSKYYLGTFSTYWPGSIYYVYVYSRALTPGEIAQLYREPYAMFRRPAVSVAALTAGAVYDLAGSIDAGVACSAMARVARRLTGASAASSEASASLSQTKVVTLSGMIQAVPALVGSLQISLAPSQPQAAWLRDALFNGMTAQAFKLGTALTRGWFWMRRAGCSAVYRGRSASEVDFGNILCVVDQQVTEVPLPAYLSHEPGSTYCYVVRRFNSCGHQELTTAATVMVAIGPDGKLTEPAPNGIFGLLARRIGGSRIQLRWFYCPLHQKVAPQVFKVYSDNGTGQLNLEITLGMISYEGRRFYDFQTGPLTQGRYMFVVRAESAAGIESMTMATVSCEIGVHCPEAATILAGEAIS